MAVPEGSRPFAVAAQQFRDAELVALGLEEGIPGDGSDLADE